MDNEKKNLHSVLMLFTLFFFVIIASNWMKYVGIILFDQTGNIQQVLHGIFTKLDEKIILIRIIYVLVLAALCWVIPSIKLNKNTSEKAKIVYRAAAIILSVILIYGYLPVESIAREGVNYYYNLVIYPFIIVVHSLVIAKAIATLRTGLKEENMLETVSSKKENDLSFTFRTDKGKLVVHSPNQGVWIDGGAGSGKTQSIIKQFIYQGIKKGYTGVIYDFEGDPNEKGAPILTKTAYTTLIENIKGNNNGKEKSVKFGFINFTDLTRTVRCNPLSSKYIEGKIHLMELMILFMKNLEKAWVQKTDFWANNAISYVQGIAWMLHKNYPEYNTLPHLISVSLTDHRAVLEWLSADDEVAKMMLPMITAFKEKASGQLAGATSSGQLPMTKLFTPEIYWGLSSDDFDLDITNPENPRILCVGNSPKLKESLSAPISLILTICMRNMNQLGKRKSFFIADELPTIALNADELASFPATARKKLVSVILSCQNFEQLEDGYGKVKASIIRGNLGNQYYGMTNNFQTAKYVSDMLGKIEKKKISYSHSTNSLSESESLQEKLVLQPRDIQGQPVGKFTGKIADGDPVFFSCRFEEFKQKEVDIPKFAIQGVLEEDYSNDEIKDNELLKSKVEENFNQINAEVEVLLDPFMPNDNKVHGKSLSVGKIKT